LNIEKRLEKKLARSEGEDSDFAGLLDNEQSARIPGCISDVYGGREARGHACCVDCADVTVLGIIRVEPVEQIIAQSAAQSGTAVVAKNRGHGPNLPKKAPPSFQITRCRCCTQGVRLPFGGCLKM